MEDYEDIDYEKRRRELLPLDLSAGGPYREIFGPWSEKIRAAREATLKRNPNPNFWDLTMGIIATTRFGSEIEKDVWRKLILDLRAFFNVDDVTEITVKFE